jgi:hypothetical protein
VTRTDSGTGAPRSRCRDGGRCSPGRRPRRSTRHSGTSASSPPLLTRHCLLDRVSTQPFFRPRPNRRALRRSSRSTSRLDHDVLEPPRSSSCVGRASTSSRPEIRPRRGQPVSTLERFAGSDGRSGRRTWHNTPLRRDGCSFFNRHRPNGHAFRPVSASRRPGEQDLKQRSCLEPSSGPTKKTDHYLCCLMESLGSGPTEYAHRLGWFRSILTQMGGS